MHTGVIVSRQLPITTHALLCLYPRLAAIRLRVRVKIPVDSVQSLPREAVVEINTSCFLWREEVLPALSPYRWVSRQSRGRKAERGGKRKRRRKRSWRKVMQAKQRERTEETDWVVAYVLQGYILALNDLESSKYLKVVSDEKEENMCKMSVTGL